MPLLALYRQVLADALLRDRLTMQNAGKCTFQAFPFATFLLHDSAVKGSHNVSVLHDIPNVDGIQEFKSILGFSAQFWGQFIDRMSDAERRFRMQMP